MQSVKQKKGTCSTPGCLNEVSVGSRSGKCRKCFYKTKQASPKPAVTSSDMKTILGTYQPSNTQSPVSLPGEAFEGAVRVTDYTTEIPLVEGSAVWCSDVHVPAHDPRLCDYVRKVGITRGVDTLIVLGDLLDNEHISSYNQAAARTMPLAEQFRRALQVLAAWATHYERIYVVQGNHDDRLMRVIEAASKSRSHWQKIIDSLSDEFEDLEATPFRHRYVKVLTEFMEVNAPALSERVVWLPLPIIEVEGPAGEKPILMVHQANYSRNAPQEAKKLWERHVQSVVTSHTHHSGVVVAPDGRHLLVNAGCMTHERHHRYLHERVRGGPAWSRGFGAIVDGRIELYLDNPYCNRWAEVDSDYSSIAA